MNVNLSSMSAQISSNIFSKIDTSNKGYLEKTDLSSALSGSDSSSSDSDALFNTLDSDSDGKVTQSELSKGIENLLGQLTSASSGSSSETQGAHKGPPPGEPPSDIDSAGVTKEQAEDMANSDDSNLSDMMKKVSANFEAADTNQDGKVSFDESMAYMKSSSSSDSSTSSTDTSSSSSSSSSSTSASLEQLEALRKIAQLIHTYGFGDTTSNSVSVTA